MTSSALGRCSLPPPGDGRAPQRLFTRRHRHSRVRGTRPHRSIAGLTPARSAPRGSRWKGMDLAVMAATALRWSLVSQSAPAYPPDGTPDLVNNAHLSGTL